MSLCKLVGILNITPDSFSDGGHHDMPQAAHIQAKKLISDGAHVIDIGAESTRPNAIQLNDNEEWRRLEPCLADIISLCKQHGVFTSIDTRHPFTANRALELGIDWLNDVNGFKNPAMLAIAANSHCKVVLMHSLTIPADPNITIPAKESATQLLVEWARKAIDRLENAGIERKRIILDPGIGFGKTASQSLEIIRHIQQLHLNDTQLLVGHSRKSFLSLATQASAMDRDIETYAVSAWCANHQVDFLRVHDVAGNRRTLNMLNILDS